MIGYVQRIGFASAVAWFGAFSAPIAHAEPLAPIWQGWYVGADVGGTSRSGDNTNIATDVAHTSSSHGWETGVYGGYNWQSGPWVYGIEGDWTHSFINKAQDDLDMFSARGRAGVAIGPALFYGTLGIATENRFLYLNRISGGTVQSFSDEQQHVGLIVGGGLEVSLSRQLSLRAEALYFDGGRETYSYPAGGGFGPASVSSSFDQIIYRAGLTYHFN